MAVEIRRWLDVDGVAQCGKEIQQIGESLRRLAFRYSRAGNNQRHTHAVFKHALLTQQSMTAECQAIVGRIHNDSIVRLTAVR